MSVRGHKCAKGSNLIEVMVAVLILAIAAMGALGYQYHAAVQSKIAESETATTHIAQMLLEDWKGTGGSSAYNPLILDSSFSKSSVPSDFDMAGVGGSTLHSTAYSITFDEIPMTAVLKWQNVDTDSITLTILRQLSAIIRWEDRPELAPVVLTTYIRVDSTGG